MNQELRQPVDRNLTPLQNIFRNRGMDYSKEAIREYVNPSNKVVEDLSKIENLKEGAEMFMKHVRAGDKMMIVVDEDCDGYTSSAFFLNYFNKLFPSVVQNNIKYVVHPNKAHGIPIDLIDEEKLIIAPDSSSNEYDIHKELKERGIDVLVIDHHEAPKFSEYACVINNQLGNYPNKSLSGVGMVWKFCSYFDKLMNTNYAYELLDLAALGVCADMMDLRPLETRWVMVNGTTTINNPFIRAMCIKNEYSIKGQLNPHKIAFYLAPGINSVTRIGTIEEKLTLFESMLDFKAYELIPSTARGKKGQMETRVEQSCRNCINIRNRQNRSKDEITEELEKKIKDKNLLDNRLLIIKNTNPINTGITGLVANQIANKYQRPTLILNRRDQIGQITWEGSGRNYSNSPLEDLRGFLESTGLVMYAQGHASAFGCGITDENFNEFVQKTNELLKEVEFNQKYDIDLEWENNDVSNFDIIDIAECADLWGQEIAEPYVVVKNVIVNKDNIQLFKEKVLKIENANGLSFVNLKSSPEEFEALYPGEGCITLNILGTCSINDYNQMGQIIIKDYEIVRKAEYQF